MCYMHIWEKGEVSMDRGDIDDLIFGDEPARTSDRLRLSGQK